MQFPLKCCFFSTGMFDSLHAVESIQSQITFSLWFTWKWSETTSLCSTPECDYDMSKEPHRGKEPTRVPFELPKPCGCESILWLYITLHGRDTPLNMRSLPSERAPTIQPFLIRFRFLTTITKACLEEHKRKAWAKSGQIFRICYNHHWY